MTCCEGWTSCNGFCLLILLLLGVILNAIPLGISLVEEDWPSQNPISCYEWWFPGIIGAGLMTYIKTVLELSVGITFGILALRRLRSKDCHSGNNNVTGSKKRACCNNRTGMFLSSLFNVITVIGAVYCMLVSLQALGKGPLICDSEANSTVSCDFSLKNLSNFHPESFNLQWFFNDTCVPATRLNNPTISNTVSSWKTPSSSNSKEDRHRIFHFSVFMSLLLVGILELLFGLSQILIGFLGCLCGVSRRRSQIV